MLLDWAASAFCFGSRQWAGLTTVDQPCRVRFFADAPSEFADAPRPPENIESGIPIVTLTKFAVIYSIIHVAGKKAGRRHSAEQWGYVSRRDEG